MKYLFLILLFILPIQADAVWFSSDWDYKVKVEVNPNKVGTTTAVTSFPVYVDLAGMPTSFWNNASSTGADIRVVESDDTTETAFELVSFATTTKSGELHFMADALATTSTSTFYIYYGNATATAYAVTDTYGRNNVWTSYVAVWHMQSLTISSTGSYDLTNSNGGGGSITSGTGKIGSGAENDGGASRLGNAAIPGLTAASSNTWQLWLKKDTHAGYWVDHVPESGGKRLIEYSGDDDIHMFASGNEVVSGITTLGTFYKFDVTKSGTSWELFMNSVSQGVTTSGAANYSNIQDFGLLNAADSFGAPSDGVVDEVRIRNSVLSDDWLTAEYNNQSSTSTFLWIGPEETNATSSPSTGGAEDFWDD